MKSAGVQRAFNCHPEENGKRYRCRGNRDGKTYEYGIDLVGTPAVRIARSVDREQLRRNQAGVSLQPQGRFAE